MLTSLGAPGVRETSVSSPLSKRASQGERVPPDVFGWDGGYRRPRRDPLRAARLRARIIKSAIAVVALACLIGIPIFRAAHDYGQGVRALAAHDYAVAADEFHAASVLGISYRDAKLLESEARRGLMDQAYFTFRRQTEAPLLAQLKSADARLKAGDPDAVMAVVATVDATDLEAGLEKSRTVRTALKGLADNLARTSRRALRAREWDIASVYSSALLALQPASERAAKLHKRAEIGRTLSAKLARARNLAHRHKWRVALNLALSIQAVQEDFPGTAVIVADARAALAPKRKPTRTVTPTTQTGGGTTVVTPAQPAAPAPAPP
jgi:hypothetical protein